MTSSLRFPLVVACAALLCACSNTLEETTTTHPPSGTEPPITGPGPVTPPVAFTALNPQQLAALVDSSACDILPEVDTANIVGMVAHPRGYPRFLAGEVAFNEFAPEDTPDPAVVRALTQGTTYENEVHDCQRLIVVSAGNLAFGPLVGIHPHDTAMKLPEAAFDTGVSIATVYNWGDTANAPMPYPRLGIGDKWNCLWLRRSSVEWRAAITTHTADECFDRPSPPDSVYTLDVVRLHHADSIPPTARWGWDADSLVQQIGIKCGDAWCWIGPPNLYGLSEIVLEGPAYSTIPGYFDEQHLAVADQQGGFVPGVYARVTPADTFFRAARSQRVRPNAEVMASFFSLRSEVAYIEVVAGSPAPPPYDSIWGGPTTPVELRMLMLPGAPPGNPPRMFSFFGPPGGQPNRTTSPRIIPGVAHASMGAVRWRWHDTKSTESIWSACGVKGTDCCDTE